MTTTATEKHAKTAAPKKAWEFTEDFDIVDTVPKVPAKRVRRAPTRGRSVAPPSPLRKDPFDGAATDNPAARHWAALAADPWRCEPQEIEDALHIITEVAASASVYRAPPGLLGADRPPRVLITAPQLLDFAHFTIKSPPERLGALIIVSIPPKAAEEITGRREFAFASKIVHWERPFEELMLWHRDKITEAIRAAKPIVSARAAIQS